LGKKRVIGGLVVLLLLLVSGGCVLFFNTPNESPEVSHDALKDLETRVYEVPAEEETPGDFEAGGEPPVVSEESTPLEEDRPEQAPGPAPEADGEAAPEEIPLTALKTEYEEKFLVLQGIAEDSLDAILLAMKEEYLSHPPEEREKEVFKAKLVTKYTKEALDLEKRVDNLFYFILDEFEARLQGDSRGKDLVENFEAVYKMEKNTLRDSLMSKVFE